MKTYTVHSVDMGVMNVLEAMPGSKTFLYLNLNDEESNFYIAERYIIHEILCNHKSLLGWLYRRDLHEETTNGH